MTNRSELSLGEFVKQLALLLQAAKVKMPLEDERRWHLLFWELKNINGEGKPAFFSRLRFDWDGPHPKSSELSTFLQTLHANASVSAINPGFKEFLVPDDTAKVWEADRARINETGQRFLQAAVERAKTEFAGV